MNEKFYLKFYEKFIKRIFVGKIPLKFTHHYRKMNRYKNPPITKTPLESPIPQLLIFHSWSIFMEHYKQPYTFVLNEVE